MDPPLPEANQSKEGQSRTDTTPPNSCSWSHLLWHKPIKGRKGGAGWTLPT